MLSISDTCRLWFQIFPPQEEFSERERRLRPRRLYRLCTLGTSVRVLAPMPGGLPPAQSRPHATAVRHTVNVEGTMPS